MPSSTTKARLVCSSCGKPSETLVFSSINVSGDPELKQKVKSGEIFLHECPFCGHRELVKSPLLYHDPDEKLLLCLSPQGMTVEGLDGYTGRRVCDVGSFIEKVKIFDDGLDDIVIEVCKYVTCQELGKTVDLKYLSLDGADNEITFTYPENGEMQMLAVGFNVYEDCRGIVSRNAVFKERSSGFAVIDSSWISEIFG